MRMSKTIRRGGANDEEIRTETTDEHKVHTHPPKIAEILTRGAETPDAVTRVLASRADLADGIEGRQ